MPRLATATCYKAGGSTTGGFQSADGAWWAIATADVNVCMFGAVSGVGNAAATTTAFSNAVTLQTSRGGGRIFIPQGNYFLNSTITLPTVTASIELIGESEESTAISANGNIVLFKVQAAYSVIRNLTLVGYNNVAAGAPTLWLATGTSGGAIGSRVEHCSIYYGLSGIYIDTGDVILEDLFVTQTFLASVYIENASTQAQAWPASASAQAAITSPSPTTSSELAALP